MKIIGIAEVNYVSKTTGQPVHGYDFFCTYESQKCVAGVACFKQYIPGSAVDSMGLPEIGNEVEFIYNRFGKVAGYQVTEGSSK